MSLYKLLETEYGVFWEKYYKGPEGSEANKEMDEPVVEVQVGDPMFDLV